MSTSFLLKKFTILKFVLQGVFVTLIYPPPPVIVQRKENLIITYYADCLVGWVGGAPITKKLLNSDLRMFFMIENALTENVSFVT